MALDKQGVPRPRCVGIVETCEESGSYDLLPYVDARAAAWATSRWWCAWTRAPALWMTTSRGMVSGTLEVQVLDEGVHSGDSSGVVPSSFRILRHLLDRLEDSSTAAAEPARSGRASIRCTPPRASWATRSGAASLELRRRRRLRAAHDHRARTGPAEPHLASDAVGDRRRGPAAAVQRRQRAARAPPSLSLRLPPLVDAVAASQEIKAAGSRRAVQRQGHLQGQRRRRHRLERAGLGALADPGAGRRLAGLLRFVLRLHRPGRHHPADEHPAKGFPKAQFMVCGWAQVQRPRPQRVPAHSYGKKLTAAVAQTMAAMPAA